MPPSEPGTDVQGMTKRDSIPLRPTLALDSEANPGDPSPLHGAETGARRWSLTARRLASAVILFHVTAVFWPPFTFACNDGNCSSSPFADNVMSWLRPYSSLMFLDHGYFFFAPNPEGSHLVHYKVEFADGREAVEGVLPNLRDEKPRLMYHRHFMLAEQLHAEFAPADPPAEFADSPEQLAGWRQARDRYELRRRSFEEHLRAAYGADQVTLTRLEHTLPGPGEFRDSAQPLNAADSYRELLDAPVPLPAPAPATGGGP